MEGRRDIVLRNRIVDIEFKISRLGILGKQFYDLAQIKLKRHRTQISIAKTQNKLLHAALGTLREKDRIARKNAGDVQSLRKTVAALRLHFDIQRQNVFKRQRKLEWQITGTHSAELQCAGVLDPNSSPELFIRSLEHKLSRVHMKMRDVQILVKFYEGALQPLREDWIVYDAKIASLQSHVNIKNQECELLINTHHDAIRARDAAKIELEELLAFLFGYGKKGTISSDLRSRIWRAVQEIKSVMDVESMRQMYHQFLVQEKQSVYLESIYEEMSRTLDLVRDENYRRTRVSQIIDMLVERVFGQSNCQHVDLESLYSESEMSDRLGKGTSTVGESKHSSTTQHFSYLSKKKSTIRDREYADRVIEGTSMLVRRQSAWRGSDPLLQLLEGTKKIVNKLHDGELTLASSDHTNQKEILEKCKLSMVKLLQSVYRQLKARDKEAVTRAELEAKEAAHWVKEEAEVARKKIAAEQARRKYEERAAAMEAQREEDETYRQMMEESQKFTDDVEAESQAQPDDRSNLPEGMVQQETDGTGLTVEEGMLTLSDHLAQKPEVEEMAEPTVIFLPTFPQAPSDAGGAARRGSATVSSADESEAKTETSTDPSRSAVMSDDESVGEGTVDDGRDGRVPSSEIAVPKTFTGTRLGHASTFKESRKPVVSSRLARAATFTETGRPPAVSSQIADVETASATALTPPAASSLEPEGPPTVVLATEEGVTQPLVISTEVVHDSQETTFITSVEILESRESRSAAKFTHETGSVGSALPDVKSPTAETSYQESVTEPTTGSSEMTPTLEAILSPELAPDVPSSTIPEDSHEKVAEKIGEGGPLKPSLKPVIVSSETLQSTSEEGLSFPALSRDVTVGVILPRSPSGAPISSVWEPGAKRPFPETISTDESFAQSPGELRSRSLPRSPSGAPIATEFVAARAEHGDERIVTQILAEGTAFTASPRDAQIMEGKPSIMSNEIDAEIHPQGLAGPSVQLTSHDELPEGGEVQPTAEVLPRTPKEMPDTARTNASGGKEIQGEKSAAQSPRTAELRLSRSPSGAPISTARELEAKMPSSETVSPGVSLPQTFGGLRSPNVELPRSPSGAPVATAAKFPFGSTLPEALSPARSFSTGRSATDTAMLATTSPELQLPCEGSLSDKGSEGNQ